MTKSKKKAAVWFTLNGNTAQSKQTKPWWGLNKSLLVCTTSALGHFFKTRSGSNPSSVEQGGKKGRRSSLLAFQPGFATDAALWDLSDITEADQEWHPGSPSETGALWCSLALTQSLGHVVGVENAAIDMGRACEDPRVHEGVGGDHKASLGVPQHPLEVDLCRRRVLQKNTQGVRIPVLLGARAALPWTFPRAWGSLHTDLHLSKHKTPA